MALEGAYNYIRENIDESFNKHAIGNISFDCEEEIEEMHQEMLEEGESAPVALYYEKFNGTFVFNDWDVIYDGMEYLKQDYITTTLKHALNILRLQNNMFDE